MLPQLPQKDKEKDAFSVLLQLFSVLLTVLSILTLTYKDLRFNSKTLPMLRQNRANYLPPASAGKNCSKTCKLSCAVYPHRTELNASIASFRRR